MSTYYKVLFDEDNVFGIAKTIEDGGLFTLPYAGIVKGWQPLILDLIEGDFADYLSSNLGCRMCSTSLQDILSTHASSDDELQWLPVSVRRGVEHRTYSILHFPNPPDVLNKAKSIFAGGFVVKPVLSGSAIGNRRVFSFPKGGELPLFVDEQVKIAIETAGCTGLELSRAAVQ
jgi:hypothetical protein